ncbi:hypothetical protein Ahy_B05g076015 [Arachis hypogaea]|uniref:Aminotransferase-like plant mobile domain-containing protein n=1 Tax=Arachis hypogaea TaxID=3818 RepID=A0A444Z2F5_ARAHY|nr:hypothetical protein Ahy_B05g076015 [Arachis hypogaea]
MTDKSNNLVHIRWLPLLRDFEKCRAFSWDLAVLAWTYQSLCSVAQRGVTDITGCTLLLMSWIYQRFSQWCPPNRGVYQYPMAARLVGVDIRLGSQYATLPSHDYGMYLTSSQLRVTPPCATFSTSTPATSVRHRSTVGRAPAIPCPSSPAAGCPDDADQRP